MMVSMGYVNQIFINIFSAVIVLVVLTSLGKPSFKPGRKATPDMVIFTYLSLSIFLILLIEGIRWHIYRFPQTTGRALHAAVFMFYFTLQFVPISLYILYVDYHLHEKVYRLRRILKIIVPINIISTGIAVSTPLTGFLFFIDENNSFRRGYGFDVFFVILFIFTLAGVILVIKGRHNRSRKTIMNLLLFPVVTIGAGLAQVLYYGLTITWPSSILFIIVAAMNIQKLQMHTDHLTGLYNRRSFDTRVMAEIERSKRYGSPLSIVMMDIDHFKRINDDFGHDVGDTVLIQIAKLLSVHTRSTDAVTRWGGEEFLILMPHTDQSRATEAAEKLRSLIEKFQFPNGICLTLSFGVAQWLPLASKNMWIKRADRAMYKAKAMGRNRVEQCPWLSIIPEGKSALDWQPLYETGDSQIDEEHKELLKIATRLLADPWDKERIRQTKTELRNHILKHFRHEERLMKEYGYAQRENHEAIHRMIVEESILAFKEVDRGFFDNLHFFLIDEIIIQHFFIFDKPFVEFMQKCRA